MDRHSSCGNCAVAIGDFVGSVGGKPFQADASSQEGSCNRAFAISKSKINSVKASGAFAGVNGGRCNMAVLVNDLETNQTISAGAGGEGSDGNIALSTNFAVNGLTRANAGYGSNSTENFALAANSAELGNAQAYSGYGSNSTENFALAINDVVNGFAEASAGDGDYSQNNKATAMNSDEAGKGAATHVEVAPFLISHQSNSGAQLVNTAGGCQEAVVPTTVPFDPRCTE